MKLFYPYFLSAFSLLLTISYAKASDTISYKLPFEGPVEWIFLPKDEPNTLISVDKNGHAFLQQQSKKEAFDLGLSEIKASVSANGQYFASFHHGVLQVWDLKKRSLRWQKHLSRFWHIGYPRQISLSLDGRFLGIIDDCKNAFLIDLNAWFPYFPKVKFSQISSLSFGYNKDNNKQVAFGSKDGSVIFYDLETMKILRVVSYSDKPEIIKLSLINDEHLAFTNFSKTKISVFSSYEDSFPSTIESTYGIAPSGHEVTLDAYEIAFSADGRKYLYLYQDQDDYGYFNDLVLQFGSLEDTLAKTRVHLGVEMEKTSAISLSPLGRYLAVSVRDKVFVKASGGSIDTR